jgi:hypothetical protein
LAGIFDFRMARRKLVFGIDRIKSKTSEAAQN